MFSGVLKLFFWLVVVIVTVFCVGGGVALINWYMGYMVFYNIFSRSILSWMYKLFHFFRIFFFLVVMGKSVVFEHQFEIDFNIFVCFLYLEDSSISSHFHKVFIEIFSNGACCVWAKISSTSIFRSQTYCVKQTNFVQTFRRLVQNWWKSEVLYAGWFLLFKMQSAFLLFCFIS